MTAILAFLVLAGVACGIGSAAGAGRTEVLTAGVQAVGTYFADDANSVEVPRSTLFSAGLAMRNPVSIGSGLGVRGTITVNNLFDRKKIASATKPISSANSMPRWPQNHFGHSTAREKGKGHSGVVLSGAKDKRGGVSPKIRHANPSLRSG